MAACGSTTARARAPSQGWLRAMKPMTLTSVPIWTTGVEMAAPANEPTISASAVSMATRAPRRPAACGSRAVSATWFS